MMPNYGLEALVGVIGLMGSPTGSRRRYMTAAQKKEWKAWRQEQRRAKALQEEKRPRIGRNDPCICGSGKKYKNCHINRPLEEPKEERDDGRIVVIDPASAELDHTAIAVYGEPHRVTDEDRVV